MSKVVLLVDGGGTSTKVAVAKVSDLESGRLPSAKHIRTFGIDSPFNVATLGPDEVPTVLKRIARETGVKFKDVVYLFCGLAGIDHPAMAGLVLEHARSVGLRKGTPMSVKNDISIGLRAEYQPGKTTGVLISGTGCNCAVESPNGAVMQISGSAWLLGDEGRSGSFLGRCAITWMIEQLQPMGLFSTVQCRQVPALGKKSGSVLLRLLSEKVGELYAFDVQNGIRGTKPASNLQHWIDQHMYADEKMGRVPDSDRVRFAGQFARPAIEAARLHDGVAIGWALAIGENLAKLLEKVARAAAEQPDRVALVGGLIARRGIIQRVFRDEVRSRLEKPPVLRPYPSGEQLVQQALIGAVAHYRDKPNEATLA